MFTTVMIVVKRPKYEANVLPLKVTAFRRPFMRILMYSTSLYMCTWMVVSILAALMVTISIAEEEPGWESKSELLLNARFQTDF